MKCQKKTSFNSSSEELYWHNVRIKLKIEFFTKRKLSITKKKKNNAIQKKAYQVNDETAFQYKNNSNE